MQPEKAASPVPGRNGLVVCAAFFAAPNVVFGAMFGFCGVRHHPLVLRQRPRNKHGLHCFWKHLHGEQRQKNAGRGR